jgi:hypothetical protein
MQIERNEREKKAWYSNFERYIKLQKLTVEVQKKLQCSK